MKHTFLREDNFLYHFYRFCSFSRCFPHLGVSQARKYPTVDFFVDGINFWWLLTISSSRLFFNVPCTAFKRAGYPSPSDDFSRGRERVTYSTYNPNRSDCRTICGRSRTFCDKIRSARNATSILKETRSSTALRFNGVALHTKTWSTRAFLPFTWYPEYREGERTKGSRPDSPWLHHTVNLSSENSCLECFAIRRKLSGVRVYELM